MLGVALTGGVAAILQREDGVVAVVLLGAAVRQSGGVVRGVWLAAESAPEEVQPTSPAASTPASRIEIKRFIKTLLCQWAAPPAAGENGPLLQVCPKGRPVMKHDAGKQPFVCPCDWNTKQTPGLLRRAEKRAPLHRSGQDDLGAGGAHALEPGDQLLQLLHAFAAHLHNEAVAAGHMEALAHLPVGPGQREEFLPVCRCDGHADQRVDAVLALWVPQQGGVTCDYALLLQPPNPAGHRRAGKRHMAGNVLHRHTGILL